MIKDHLGNSYESVKQMAKAYQLPYKTVHMRLKRGWSIEKTLTSPVQNVNKTCMDHEGRTFKSVKDMVKYYGISEKAFHSRLHNGWSLKDSLTIPLIHDRTMRRNLSATNKGVSDHLGNNYPSETLMVKHYKIPLSTYRERIKKGWSMQKALTTPVKPVYQSHKDCFGQSYESMVKMTKAYHVHRKTFMNRINAGESLSQALGITPLNHVLEKYRVLDTDYYLYDINNKNVIVTFEEIETYHMQKYEKEVLQCQKSINTSIPEKNS